MDPPVSLKAWQPRSPAKTSSKMSDKMEGPGRSWSSSAKFCEALVTEESAKKNEPGTWASLQPAQAAVRAQHTIKICKAEKNSDQQ